MTVACCILLKKHWLCTKRKVHLCTYDVKDLRRREAGGPNVSMGLQSINGLVHEKKKVGSIEAEVTVNGNT